MIKQVSGIIISNSSDRILQGLPVSLSKEVKQDEFSYRGVFGHESVNELIVCRVMDVLGIPHLQYRLIQNMANDLAKVVQI